MDNFPDEIWLSENPFNDDGFSCYFHDGKCKYEKAEKNNWRAIETAPDDEEVLMVNSKGLQKVGFVERSGEENWASSDWSYADGTIHVPTHWMPLPAPPVRLNKD